MSGVPQQADALAAALQQSRARTLALMDAWCHALPSMRVPERASLNLPLWEWGHVGWFQTWWIGRNPQRGLGLRCSPDHPRTPPAVAGADALYDSSTVAHASRWSLALPGLHAVRAELARGLAQTLDLLEQAAQQGHDLYCWQLVLVHEDMHQEAALYMAQALDLPMGTAADVEREVQPQPPSPRRRRASVAAQTLHMGQEAVAGRFCFDNECGPHERVVPAFEIDLQPVSWGEYLDFVQATGHRMPSVVQGQGGRWQMRHFGQWRDLDLSEPAAYLSAADAQAWCDWAGRALPTEAQWECAALGLPDFQWGWVWEWTASTFEPYPGFVAHPYRDYSAPWFGTHRVLRGASRFTAPRLRSPRYRNFFLPDRQDLPAGFRTVSRGPGV
jgi:ergothioneine biosynthesis protein EgtB